MTEDITRASEPIADKDGVRFSVFFEMRGPQVFEVSAHTMVRLFGAKSYSADDMLAAFYLYQREIISAARAWHGQAGLGAHLLDDALWAERRQQSVARGADGVPPPTR